MTILDKIVESKRREVEALRHAGYYSAISAISPQGSIPSMADAVRRSSTGIIAEFKRRSPSKGLINGEADVETAVRGYASNGAAASSVLTDTAYFGGSISDLVRARRAVADLHFPLLRKEFVVAREQIDEARAFGASAVLLIASVLSAAELLDFASYARSIGLEVLLEIHSIGELAKAIPAAPEMLGVNSRNLADMSTDVAHAEALGEEVASQLPDTLLVAESGIACCDDMVRLRGCGYGGFLIGERFMRHSDPAAALHDFVN